MAAATDFRSAMLHTRTKLPYLPERRHSTPRNLQSLTRHSVRCCRKSRRIRYLPTISPQTDSIMPVTTAPVSTMPYFPTTAYMSAMFAALRHVTRISTVPTASATTSTRQRQVIMRARVITAFTTSRAEPHRGPKSRERMLT